MNLCNICNKSFDKVIGFSCCHQICGKCFYKEIIFNFTKIFTENFSLVSQYKCILCEKGTAELNLKQVYDFMNESLKIKFHCNNGHKKQIEFYCKNCKWKMCKKCLDQHNLIKPFTNHQIIYCENFNINDKCSEHIEKPLIYFCYTCEVPACIPCLDYKHKTHQFDLIDKKYDERFLTAKRINLPYDDLTSMKKELITEEENFKIKINSEGFKLESQIDHLINRLCLLKKKITEKKIAAEMNTVIINRIYSRIFSLLAEDLEHLDSNDYNNIDLMNKFPKKFEILNFTYKFSDKTEDNLLRIGETLKEIEDFDIFMFKEENKQNKKCKFYQKLKLDSDIVSIFSLTSELVLTISENNEISIIKNSNEIFTTFNTFKLPFDSYAEKFYRDSNKINLLTCLALDNKRLILSFDNGEIKIVYNYLDSYSCDNLQLNQKFIALTMRIFNSNCFVAGGDDGVIMFFNCEYNTKYKPEMHTKINVGSFPIRDIAVINEAYFVCSISNYIHLMHCSRNTLSCTKSSFNGGKTISKLLSYSQNKFLCLSEDKIIKFWQFTNELELNCVGEFTDSLLSNIFFIKNNQFAILNYKEIYFYFDQEKKKTTVKEYINNESINKALVIPDSYYLSAEKNEIIIWTS